MCHTTGVCLSRAGLTHFLPCVVASSLQRAPAFLAEDTVAEARAKKRADGFPCLLVHYTEMDRVLEGD